MDEKEKELAKTLLESVDFADRKWDYTWMEKITRLNLEYIATDDPERLEEIRNEIIDTMIY